MKIMKMTTTFKDFCFTPHVNKKIDERLSVIFDTKLDHPINPIRNIKEDAIRIPHDKELEEEMEI